MTDDDVARQQSTNRLLKRRREDVYVPSKPTSPICRGRGRKNEKGDRDTVKRHHRVRSTNRRPGGEGVDWLLLQRLPYILARCW